MEIKQKLIEGRVDIWKTPPGYSTKSKLEDMNIDFEANRYDATVSYARKINNTEYEDISRIGDTFTYLHEIKQGYELQTYEDIPYIIPHIVEGSKHTVLVLSGGGFAYKTIDGSKSGGKAIAERLNKNGISAVLLHYRTNPYKFPIPMLDLQRAIRFLKQNREEYGFEDGNLHVMGFSAGAYVVASFINKYMGEDSFPIEYEKDEIDGVSDAIEKAAFIYPQLTFNYHLPMLTSVKERRDILDEDKRDEILKELDLKNHINSSEVMQFAAYSNKDTTIPQDSVEDYIKSAKDKGVNFTRIFIPGEEHGFSDDLYIDDLVSWINF